VPSFWLALILMIVLGLHLGVLPISGTGTWQHFVMPGIVLAFTAIPALTRSPRSGMIEAMAHRTTSARTREGPVARAHHLQHAFAMPRFRWSIAAVQLGFNAGRSIVIETVFALHRRRLSRLGEHRQERFPGGAAVRAGAGHDLYGSRCSPTSSTRCSTRAATDERAFGRRTGVADDARRQGGLRRSALSSSPSSPSALIAMRWCRPTVRAGPRNRLKPPSGWRARRPTLRSAPISSARLSRAAHLRRTHYRC